MSIHSFFIPAFRIKHDVVPGHATRRCGSRRQRPAPTGSNAPNSAAPQHAKMAGDGRRHGAGRLCRLAGGAGRPANRSRSRARRCSAQLRLQRLSLPRAARCTRRRSPAFTAGSCICMDGSTVRGRRAATSATRSCCPKKQIVAGYPPVMPSFAGQIGEDDLHEADRLYPISFAREPAEWRTMSAEAAPPILAPKPSYLTSEMTVGSWLLTHDHKRIALMFFASITFFFFIGGAAATLIRLHLATPNGASLQPDVYNRMFTMHGIVMVWFFLIPSIPTTLGNFLVPLMIGAHDLAFPRLNLGQLVRLQSVRAGAALCPDHGRRRHRLVLSIRRFDAVRQRLCLCRRDGRVHQRLFDDPDGAEFRRHDPSAARARHDLDAAAACSSGRSTRSAS